MKTMMVERITSLSFSCVALLLGACAEAYTPEMGIGVIEPEAMAALYYGINPPRHAEKATVDHSGSVVVLVTTIYNRPPFGRLAELSLCDREGRACTRLAVPTPGRIDVTGLAEGAEVSIRPETIGTMAKILTPEQIAGAAEAQPR